MLAKATQGVNGKCVLVCTIVEKVGSTLAHSDTVLGIRADNTEA